MPNPPDDYFETPDGIIYGDPPFWWGTPDDWKFDDDKPNGGSDDETEGEKEGGEIFITGRG